MISEVIYIENKKKVMTKRVTIVINRDLDKKIREYQSRKIQKENASFSYSKAINELLKKSI